MAAAAESVPTSDPQESEQVAAAPTLWREVVGEVLREERQFQQQTIQQVADRAGISAQYLSEVERGRKEPSSEMLSFIGGALALDLPDLLMRAAGRLQPVQMRLGHFGVVGIDSPGQRLPSSGPVALAMAA